eukprot:scaffold13806_cov80-Skeletonema_dohrnii-CCMP3373.AAC.1
MNIVPSPTCEELIMVFIQTRPSEILRPLLHLSTLHAPTTRIHFLQPPTIRPRLHQSVCHPPTQQAPRASSGTARTPPGLSSPFSTDPCVREYCSYAVFNF